MYRALYSQLMEEHIEKAKNNPITSESRKSEWAVIAAAMEQPRYGNDQLAQLVGRRYGIFLNEEEMKQTLFGAGLKSEQSRTMMREQAVQGAKALAGMLQGDKASAEALRDIISAYRVRRYRKGTQLPARCIIIYALYLSPELREAQYQLIARTYMEPYCEKLLRELLKDIGGKMGVSSGRSTKQLLEDTQKTLQGTRSIESDDGEGMSEVERLRFEISNYQATLETLQCMYDEITDNLESATDEAKTEGMCNFFAMLNEGKYGCLLDGICAAEEKLKVLRKERFKIPPQLMPVTVLIKQLAKFIHDMKIEPIATSGKTFSGTYADVKENTYNGTPFGSDTEVKQLVVTSPGWQYSGHIISLPVIREVEEE